MIPLRCRFQLLFKKKENEKQIPNSRVLEISSHAALCQLFLCLKRREIYAHLSNSEKTNKYSMDSK